jgi:hypothetical protein
MHESDLGAGDRPRPGEELVEGAQAQPMQPVSGLAGVLPSGDHDMPIRPMRRGQHTPPNCPHCRPAMLAFLEATRVHAPSLFPRRVVCNIQRPADDALSYMEASLLQVAMHVQPLVERFQSLASQMGYQSPTDDCAAAAADLRDYARATAEAVLHLLQPSAYVATPVATKVINMIAPPPALDPLQEAMAITRAAVTLTAALQQVLLECPCHQPLF